jgi:hypothetical protein
MDLHPDPVDEGAFVVPIADDIQASIYRPCKRGTKSAGVAFSPIVSFTNNGSGKSNKRYR